MKNHTKITKAVITVAGIGTRLLPATKNQPKEMLPVIDKPIIHYLVEEAVASGITDIILVTRAGHHITEDYFDNSYDLEAALEKAGKYDKLKLVRDIPQMANFIYVRQKGHLPYGNGSPLLAVKNLIDENEAFVYMFGDDLMLSKVPVTKQLMDIYYKYNPTAVVSAQDIPWEEVEKFGTIKYKKNPKTKYEIEKICEKLPSGKAPSNTMVTARFILSHGIIKAAEKTKTGKGNELWLTDILNQAIQSGKKVLACPFEGRCLIIGEPLTYLKTTLKIAMERDDLKDDLKKFIKDEIL